MKNKNEFIKLKIISLTIFVNVIFVLFASIFFYSTIKKGLFEKLKERLNNIVTLSAKIIDTNDMKDYVEKLKNPLSKEEIFKIEQDEKYKKIYSDINYIRNIQKNFIKYIYILIPTNNENIVKFLIDGDLYKDLNSLKLGTYDKKIHGPIAQIGYEYDILNQLELKEAFRNKQKIITNDFVYDNDWNQYSLMGFHPLYDKNNEFIGILGIDIIDQKYFDDLNKIKLSFIFVFGILFLISILIGIYLGNMFFKISNLVQTQKELKDSYEKLRELDVKKTNFINIASHELRTPMTSINGYISMILDGDFGEINNEAKNILYLVNGNVLYLLTLISDMLDVSRIESGKQELIYEEFNLGDYINSIIIDLSPLSKNKNISLNFISYIKTNSVIKSCKKSVKKIIINLLGNAIKYTNEGGSIKIELIEENEIFKIKFIDNGVGIDKKDFEKIFEKFGQVGDSLNKESKGTGLGLAIVKELINAINGEISLESELGIGSTFTVILKKD